MQRETLLSSTGWRDHSSAEARSALGSFATGVVSAASLAMSALHRKRLNCCAATKRRDGPNKGHGQRDLDIEILGFEGTVCTGADRQRGFEGTLIYRGAAALREDGRLSRTGLEVSLGLTVSRERETRHWRR
jgi:hypothetical protein